MDKPATDHRAWIAVAVCLAGVAALSAMDALMKGAALAAGAYSAALLRAAMAGSATLPIWLVAERRRIPRPVLRLHILRGVVSAFMALSFFYALTKLPIAETIAISFIAPLVALYLAAVWLGERIERRAIVASLIGFTGTLVIVGGRLGGTGADGEALKGIAAILFSAVLYAANIVIIRRQATLAGPVEATLFHGGVSALTLGMAAPFFFEMPAAAVLLPIAGAAGLTVAGAMAISWAYARAEAQVLIPLEYSGFIWAAFFGWLAFGEGVSLTTLCGTALITGACLIAARPRRRTFAAAAQLQDL